MTNLRKTAASALFLAIPLFPWGTALAQIQSVTVSKGYGYVQTGPGSATLDPASNNYGFGADVDGVGIGSIPAPIVTGPINVGALGTIHNNGRLVYSNGDHAWRWGNPSANDFGTSSLASLNSFFANGTYTINVNGVNVVLQLNGDAYPNAPVLTLTGGAWSGGKYVIDANQPLGVTTSAFTAYGTHADDGICGAIFGPGFDKPFNEVAPYGCAWAYASQSHSTTPGSNVLSFTVPAHTLTAGNDYRVGAIFAANVDFNPQAGLPGSVNTAYYHVYSVVTVSVVGGAPQVGNGQVSGSIKGPDAVVSFSCIGSPTCTGTYTMSGKDSTCSNSFSFTDVFAMTGVVLDAPGPLRGTFTLTRSQRDPVVNGNGTCTYPVTGPDEVRNYSGTWDGRTGTITSTQVNQGGVSITVNGTFTGSATVATLPPVFPITVTGSVTPTLSNISATFQPRSQDVGTSQKVFVFALAPATAVPHAVVSKDTHKGLMARDFPNDDPVPCVLAQLSASGQLIGVTASTMQALATNVLTAQGQSVSVLNNVATPSVAGATFFVGYGADGNAMINSGVNRSAVTVPGAVTCQPQPPQTGWWWNPLEGGRGFSIEAHGNNLFFAAFHYDATGRATWNVSPGPVSLNGSFFTSELYNVTGGQTLAGPFHDATAEKAGTITLAFNDDSHGTMIWPGGSVPIERQPFVPGSLALKALPNQPESGWWWNPQESGRGFFIEWQGGKADIAGYMYDDNGKPTWYIAVYDTPNPRVFTGNWWTFANGQVMGGAYKAPDFTSDHFAPLSINFTGPDTAVMTLPGGRTTNLQRQRF